MKKLFFILLVFVSTFAFSQTQTYLTPVSVTAGNEQINSNKGIRATGGSGYNEARNVVRFTETIASGESVSFDVVQSNNFYSIGLAVGNGETNVYSYPVGNTNMIFGMLVGADNGGNLNVAKGYDAGYAVGSNTAIAAGNVLRINYSGSTITYQKSTDGGVNFTTFHTSATTASGSYYVYFEAPPQLAGPANIYKTGTVVNQPPTVSAGIDVPVTLPISVATLNGLATDADGTISSVTWVRLSGPSGASILSANNDTTQLSGLVEGTYVFRLSATDDDGASSSDDVTVTVAAADPNGTTIISPSIIPLSDPEIVGHGRGAEDWQGQNYVNIPTEDVQTERKSYYFRWAWAEIERGDNVFDWTVFDREINQAITKGQDFSFGFMAQSASASWRTGIVMDSASGYVMFYPLYLHNLMQAETVNNRDWISTLANEWVPNYNSPNFLTKLKRFQDSVYNHIQNGSYLGVSYKNVINYYDLRIVGDWGEWHFNTTAPDTTAFPTGRQPTIAALDSIISQSVDAMPTFKSVINVSVYDAHYLPNTWIPPAVTWFALTKQNQWGRIGYRRDQWGFAANGATYIPQWTNLNLRTGNGMRFDTAIMNLYKYAPIVGEPPGNWNNFDVPYMKNLPAEVRLYRPMSFGNGNFYTSPMFRPDLLTTGTRDSVRLASKLAGHRIQIDSATMSSQGIVGGTINVRTYWRNAGVSPVYDRYIAKWKVKNSSGTVVITDTSSFRAFLFLPSSTATVYDDQISIPSNLSAGTYSLSLYIEDSLGYRMNLPLANYGRQSDGSYILRPSFSILTGTSNQTPLVSISGTRTVTLPLDTDTLYASANDPDGTISSYAWTKVSGPSGGTIVTPTASSTRITGLTEGNYIYEVLVTDNGGATSVGSIFITVQTANISPSANAGGNVLVRTPTTTAYLNGAGSDTDGSISTYAWTKISGPSGGTIVSPSSAVTQITGLNTGSYVYRLTVTDNNGATATNDATVTVSSVTPSRKRVFIKIN